MYTKTFENLSEYVNVCIRKSNGSDLAKKNVLKEKKSKRWLLSGKDTFSGHELGFSLRASVKIWCEWFHWTKVIGVEETPWVLEFPN